MSKIRPIGKVEFIEFCDEYTSDISNKQVRTKYVIRKDQITKYYTKIKDRSINPLDFTAPETPTYHLHFGINNSDAVLSIEYPNEQELNYDYEELNKAFRGEECNLNRIQVIRQITHIVFTNIYGKLEIIALKQISSALKDSSSIILKYYDSEAEIPIQYFRDLQERDEDYNKLMNWLYN